MAYLVTLNDPIDFFPETERAEILQNVRTILGTLFFSVPLDRDFGVSGKFIDKPLPVAQSLMIAEVIEAVEEYEPRAKVESVELEQTADDAMNGRLIPRVYVSIPGEEEDEE